MNREIILEVDHLIKHFRLGRRSVLKAVDDVSFNIYKGETLGLVGESGCGKTTCGRTCIGLYPKTGGCVLYKGQDVHNMDSKRQRKFTSEVQTIFQDPYSSLDPRMRVMDIISEGIWAHRLASNRIECQDIVYCLLEQVGLSREHATRYVHEFSGGQRQRIGIARALAVNPEFILCDEPISALDVSIQAQIVNLLVKLQEERGLTYLFIAHDLSMVKHISDRVAVMYLGSIVEITESSKLYINPMHPYTQALLSAVSIADPDVERNRKRIILDEEAKAYSQDGCLFAPRCKHAYERCRLERPCLKELVPGHFVACNLYEK